MDERSHVLQLHITHLCNLRCTHCYQENYTDHMKPTLFNKVLEEYTEFVEGKYDQVQINLTGGEPLIHPMFFDFAKEVKAKGYRLGILTNGTLIDQDLAYRIKQLKPAFVQISLDGTEKTHDQIRGVGNFNKALHGIDCLKAEGIRVLVSFTAQQSNYRDFLHLVKVCRKHHVDKLWWDRVVTDSQTTALSTKHFIELLHLASRVQCLDKIFCRKQIVQNCRAMQFFGDRNSGGYRCAAGDNLLAICADGSVMPCRRLPFVIGNVSDEKLSSIIQQSQMMRELKTALYPPACTSCKDLLRCHGGAKCVTYAQTGNAFERDVNCIYR